MKGRAAAAAAAVLSLFGTPACGPSSADAQPWFEDATERSGIDFVHDSRRTYFLPELMGPGVALFDYDGDGDLDAYLVNAWPSPGERKPVAPDRLYRQEADGRFTDVTAASGLGDMGFGMGVAVGDYDNDADLDVYVTNYGTNALYRNRGDGTFENVTERAGVGEPGWSTSAAFFDYDADGWLDLYVATYLAYEVDVECPDPTGRIDYCPPSQFGGVPDRLYRNRGDGTFEDVSESSGIAGGAAQPGMGVVAADLTGDGWIDIFVANDLRPNHLWVNRGDGTFRDDAVVMGVAFDHAGVAESSMGVVYSDLDGDLEFELFVTNLHTETHTAYRRTAAGLYSDDTASMGLLDTTVRFTGFGVAALDLEHDGDLDLATVNGHVFRATPEPGVEPGSPWADYAQPGQILENTGQGRFVDASARAGRFGTAPDMGRGLATGDVDDDGDLDLLAGYCGGRARLYLNQTRKRGHWLSVRAYDGWLKRDAIGAIVGVQAEGRRFLGLVAPAQSYLSSSDFRVHFGLGEAESVDEIVILWPDGVPEKFEGGAVDRRVLLVRGFGEPAVPGP